MMNHNPVLAFLFMLSMLSPILNCSFLQAQNNPQRESEDTLLFGGQSPPGNTPKIFLPGNISTSLYEHSTPVFSKSNTEVYWTILTGAVGSEAKILSSKLEKDKWNKPEVDPAFNLIDDMYPVFSKDKSMLFFSSGRDKKENKLADNRGIWVIDKGESNPSNPEYIGFDSLDIYAVSVSESMNLYFMARHISGRGSYDIYYSQYKNGAYLPPHNIGKPINSDSYEDGPFIYANEEILLFESLRQGGEGKLDIYLSVRKDGKWSEPINLGSIINSEFNERFPRISDDGNYLFFGSDRTGNYEIYWIDINAVPLLSKWIAHKKENYQ